MKPSSPLYRPSPPTAAAVCFLAALAVAGCGPNSSATLAGKVTYKGQPVPGTLTLSSDGAGAPASYPIQVGEDGQFNTSGVPKGTYKVGVTPAPALPTPQLPPGVAPPPGMEGKLPAAAAAIKTFKHVDIPLKYLQPLSSGITWEVKEGSQRKDFELTD